MRRNQVIFLVILLGTLGILTYQLFTPITLLFEDVSEDAIKPGEIPAPNSTRIDSQPHKIPKIIHQTYKNNTIPEIWKKPQKSCIDLHPDYEYKFWTDESAREFIRTEYPWFLETFDSYQYNIMRADTIRYFILPHFGGVYLDLDVGCERRLDPLLKYPAWVRKTRPTGISNNAMGSVTQHPFFLKTIETLRSHNRNWHVPYLTVMASTGPLFLSIIWKEYVRRGVTSENAQVRILMPDEYTEKDWSFFKEYQGSSWHKNDGDTFLWLGQHWLIVTIVGFAVGLSILYYIYSCTYKRNAGSPAARGLFPWSKKRTMSGDQSDKWKV